MNREDFEILKDVTYLDSAATSQKPKIIIDKVSEYYKKYNANPHRGEYKLSEEATAIYENSRNTVADFINASTEEIIFTRNTTESINLVAYSFLLNNLKEGDEIVISIMEHHSNLVPYQEVCKKTGARLKYLYINKDYEIDDSELSKITNKTKFVAITHISNVLGVKVDIKKIIDISHSVGAKVLVDAAQSIMHTKVDVKDLNCDFLAFSGHKMLSFMGIGVLYAKKELLDNMPPFLVGGDNIEYVEEFNTTYALSPRKFEAGTQNVSGAYSLALAINYLNSIGQDKIEKYEKELINYAKEKLSSLPFLETYFPIDSYSILSFNIKGVHSHDVSSLLSEENVAVRSGLHCAHPLLNFLNIDSCIRMSICFYNNKEDVDNLVNALIKVNNRFSKYRKD